MNEKKALEALVVSEDDLTKVQSVLTTRQLDFLFKPTPKSHIYERPAKGGGTWKYVTGVYVKKVLNMIFGWRWNFEVQEFDVNLEAKQVIVLGKLTCTTIDGNVIIKNQFGRADIKFKTEWKDGKKYTTDQPLDLGNDLKAATTDALKKCASEIGIASDIYGAEEFKHISVVEGSKKLNTEEKLEKIKELYDSVYELLDEEDSLNIDRIISKEEKASYDMALSLLTKTLKANEQ